MSKNKNCYFHSKNQKKQSVTVLKKLKEHYKFKLLVGNVGYAPTTPRMSIEYSTIELIPP